MQDKIQIFEKQPVRAVWNEEDGEWYFSVTDIVSVLTDQPD
jgi:prophage antirepressor-like protein